MRKRRAERRSLAPFQLVLTALAPSAGIVNCISVPLPNVLAAFTVPLCAQIACRAIDRPTPAPPGLLVRYGCQILSRLSGGMPLPLSATVMRPASRPPSLANRPDAVMRPLAPDESTALR